jgi:hypothetical protein
MKDLTSLTAARLALLPLLGALVIGFGWPLGGAAQDKTPDPGQHKHTGKSADADKDMAAQLRDLQAKIAKLEAALRQGHKGTLSGTTDTGGMSGMPMGMMGDKKNGMGMMGMGDMDGMKPDEMMGQMMQKMGEMMQMMGQMQGKGMPSMAGMDDKQKMGMGMMGGPGMGGMQGKSIGGVQINVKENEMIGMMGMGRMGQGGMPSMGVMQMPSALPGFPGASHIYHIGAASFFLDHPDHIKLTTKQQATLNSLKEKALLEKSTSQRKIDEAEQELWTLTASDQPDATKIDAKVRDIEKLRGDQRLAFIRAVGQAAKTLTDEQRQALLGTSADKQDKAGSHTRH